MRLPSPLQLYLVPERPLGVREAPRRELGGSGSESLAGPASISPQPVGDLRSERPSRACSAALCAPGSCLFALARESPFTYLQGTTASSPASPTGYPGVRGGPASLPAPLQGLSPLLRVCLGRGVLPGEAPGVAMGRTAGGRTKSGCGAVGNLQQRFFWGVTETLWGSRESWGSREHVPFSQCPPWGAVACCTYVGTAAWR